MPLQWTEASLASVKSAYELAMERLSRQAPARKLSAQQKQRIAELDSLYLSRIAQQDLSTQAEVTQWTAAGDAEKVNEARVRFSAEKQKLEAELEAKKERIRSEGSE